MIAERKNTYRQTDRLITILRSPVGRDQRNSRRKCVISRDVSENMPNFTENSRAPQTLFRGAMLMQTKKSVE